MPFALLFDKKHKVLLVRFGRALTRQALEAMVQAAREFAALHEPMVVRDLQAACDLLGLKDPDFQPFIAGNPPE